MRVVVIGAGISGLAAAWYAGRFPDTQVLVLEAADRIGGKLRVDHVGGHLVDVGAEAMLVRRPEGLELIHEAGLAEGLVAPRTTAAGVFAGGVVRPLPARTVLGVPSDIAALRASGVLDPADLAVVVGEPRRAPLPPLDSDVAVGDLVGARFGRGVVDRLVQPLLGGVYAGRADALSLQATVPALHARLAAGGSLLAAARAAAGMPTTSTAPPFASLRGGLGALPGALAASGRFAVRVGVTVRAVGRTPDGFAVQCGPVARPELVTADAVIVAVPSAKAATMLGGVAPTAAAELGAVQSASVAIVTLAYRDVVLPPGSGLLVGAGENVAIKAVTLLSQKWPGTPDGTVLLRASVGRSGETRDLQRDDADLVALVRRDLTTLIGIRGDPVDHLVTRWGGSLPQYAVGHVDRVARIRASVAGVPALAVCGATYDGVGIPACIASARAAADEVISAARASRPAVPSAQ